MYIYVCRTILYLVSGSCTLYAECLCCMCISKIRNKYFIHLIYPYNPEWCINYKVLQLYCQVWKNCNRIESDLQSRDMNSSTYCLNFVLFFNWIDLIFKIGILREYEILFYRHGPRKKSFTILNKFLLLVSNLWHIKKIAYMLHFKLSWPRWNRWWCGSQHLDIISSSNLQKCVQYLHVYSFNISINSSKILCTFYHGHTQSY